MIRYVTLGTNDLDRAVKFYDALLAKIGATRLMEVENYFVAWAVSPEEPSLAITKPFDGNKASIGNGTMVSILIDKPEDIDAFYKKALELGATDEGKPGPRNDGAFYAGYFRDLDGNKLNALCMIPK